VKIGCAAAITAKTIKADTAQTTGLKYCSTKDKDTEHYGCADVATCTKNVYAVPAADLVYETDKKVADLAKDTFECSAVSGF